MSPIWVLITLCFGLVHCQNCTRGRTTCPDYAVVATYEDFEERLYPPLTWIGTSAEGRVRNDVSEELIKRLYGYLGGANDRGENLSMMVPVRTAKNPVNDSDTFIYTMAIVLDMEEPPQPTDPLVVMEKDAATRYVTRSFGGFAGEESEWDNEADQLKNSVAEDAAVDISFYYRCVYDSPWKLEDRLNEVWMLKNSVED